ncbi:hypothetical protein F511_31677 [Dorcoceras hygrometricum]|uniref:Delphilin-like n=1 Tax=Dorcoceras hygrometricum TaxID=472368 RepID=A0A2Z7C4H3_9LAMI|nr:hypothetical protein F511_31677 [Dorcoceras hygrometricum]
MASAFIANAYQVHFKSVLAIPDHEGMLNMFRALEASGLRGFLGCEFVLYEKELEQFFDTALVHNGDITGAVSGKFFSVSQSRFAEVFALPTEGLVDFSDVPKNMVFVARSIFSKSGEQVSTHGKKKFMKYEYRLLNDILARQSLSRLAHLMQLPMNTQKKAKGFAVQICVLLKSIPAITMGDAIPFPTSKVLSITTINSYIAMNHTVDARGQSEEPSMANVAVVKRKSKSKRKPESPDETPMEVISEVAGSKKRPTIEGNEPVIPKKRRTVKSKASPSKASLDVVPVAQDVVPLQIVEPTPAVKSPTPKRKSRKRRLILSTGSDDENLDEQESVKDTTEVTDKETTVKHTDEVDVIIGQVLEETSMLATDETEPGDQRIDETEIGDDFEKWLDADDENLDEQESVKDTTEVTDKETTVKHTDEVDVIIGQVLEETSMLATDETEPGDQRIDETEIGDDFEKWLDESFKDFASRDNEPAIGSTSGMDRVTGTEERVAYEQSLEMVDETGTTVEADGNMMLPSVTAAEVTKIRLAESIAINEVQERDWYYSNLPRISTHDKGKEPLEEDETVKGNPARETVELICGDVDFLVQLRDQVMKDVVEFFHSFSLNKLSDLDALRDLKEKEKLMLDRAETDSLETAVRRKMYILAKYREMLLRKFLDSHRRYFTSGQPWTAMASKIIDLLSAVHSKSLEDLQAQQQEHGIEMVQPSSSLFSIDSTAGSGTVLAQFYSMAKSTCWVWPMILIDGIWTPIQGTDYWNSSCRLSLFVNRKQVPESVVDTTFVPHVFFIEPVQYWGAAPSLIKTWGWARVCTEIVRYNMFGCLCPVSENFCRDIVVFSSAVDILEKLPTSFRSIFQQGVYTDSFVDYFSSSDVQNIAEVDLVSSDGSTVYLSPSPQHDSFTEAEYAQPCVHVESSSIPSFSVSDPVAQLVHINEFKKGVLAHGATVIADLMDVKKEVRAIDEKLTLLDGQVAATRNDLLDFHAQAQHTLNIITEQLSKLVDYINRGGMTKRGKEVAAAPNHLLMIKVEVVEAEELVMEAKELVIMCVQLVLWKDLWMLIEPEKGAEGIGVDITREEDSFNMLSGCSVSSSEIVGLSNQLYGLSGQISTVESALRVMVAANRHHMLSGCSVSGSETVGLSNQLYGLSGQISTVESALRVMVAANRHPEVAVNRYVHNRIIRDRDVIDTVSYRYSVFNR